MSKLWLGQGLLAGSDDLASHNSKILRGANRLRAIPKVIVEVSSKLLFRSCSPVWQCPPRLPPMQASQSVFRLQSPRRCSLSTSSPRPRSELHLGTGLLGLE